MKDTSSESRWSLINLSKNGPKEVRPHFGEDKI